jgi:nucleolar protein 53
MSQTQILIHFNFFRLPDITKKVEEDEKKREEDRRQREENAKQRQLQQPAQLSKYKYTPIPMAIQTTDEVVPSLRQLKPESNIFKERFNQMQKRNLIETRVPISLRRRYELKNIEKYSYKRFE